MVEQKPRFCGVFDHDHFDADLLDLDLVNADILGAVLFCVKLSGRKNVYLRQITNLKMIVKLTARTPKLTDA